MALTRNCVVSVLAAVLSAPTAAAVAANAPAATSVQSATDVGEVVVTAQKREEKIFEVPLAVQAISRLQLQQSGATKVSDLVTAIPGASMVSGTTPGFETIQIRGIGSGTTGDGLVGFYIDDTPFGVPNLQLTPPARLLDLDRVEVIRGPSGTLYGQGSMGGTIKLVTTKPNPNAFSGTFQGEVSGTDSAGANAAFDGAVNLPIIRDRLALRISGGYQYLSGFADVPEQNLHHANDFKGSNIRATFLWTPSETFDVTGFFWHIINRQNFSNDLTPHNPVTESLIFTPWGQDDIAGLGGHVSYTDVSADISSLTLHWRTPIGELTSNTSYIQHNLSFNDPLLTILDNNSSFKTNSVTEEVRLASAPSAPFHYIAGVSYRDATIHSNINYYEDLVPLGIPVPYIPVLTAIGPLHTRSVSVFGEVSKAFFDGKLEPLVGLRYFHDDRGDSGYDPSTGVQATPQSATFHSLNPRFNLKYKVTDNALVFVNIAKGFRSGALQTPSQAIAANALLGLPPGTIGTQIQPDSLWTYEAGARLRLGGGAVLLEASYYHTDWSKVLVQFQTAAVISIANGGNAKIDGVDLSATWRTPLTGLSLSANGNINNSRFDYVIPALALHTALRVGGQLPNVPKGNATVAADYDWLLPWLENARGLFHLAYSYRAKQTDATTPGVESGSVNDVSIRAGVKKGPVRLEAFVDNALNDKTPTVATVTTYEIQYPRRIGLQLGYSF